MRRNLELVVNAHAKHLVGARIHVLACHGGAVVAASGRSSHILGVVVIHGPEVAHVEFHLAAEVKSGTQTHAPAFCNWLCLPGLNVKS